MAGQFNELELAASAVWVHGTLLMKRIIFHKPTLQYRARRRPLIRANIDGLMQPMRALVHAIAVSALSAIPVVGGEE